MLCESPTNPTLPARLRDRLRVAGALAVSTLALALAPATAAAAGDVQHLSYRIGPFHITPGQNRIAFAPIAPSQRPAVPGYITRIKPNLTYLNGKIPRVDIVHLHHAVWLNLSRKDATMGGPERFFAAGEEKTIFRVPPGYGYYYDPKDRWVLNHMLHDLVGKPAEVYVTYDIDFVPADSPTGRRMKAVRPIWMDVQNGSLYPVFDVLKGSGEGGRFTFPDQARNPYRGGPRNVWRVDRDGVLVAGAGHVHPGGLYTDLWLNRPGATPARARCAATAGAARRRCLAKAPTVRGQWVHLLRSKAKYFGKKGPIDWDLAMTGSRPDWQVQVRKGDLLRITATYDSSRAAWYESMGIMVLYMADGSGGKDPLRTKVDYIGTTTHGRLPENIDRGGRPTNLPNPLALPAGGPAPSVIGISDFRYQVGDFLLPGAGKRPPVVRRGQQVLFVNGDDGREIYHSVTSCREPCNRSSGIGYPLADGRFDSGQLGSRLPGVGRVEWQLPTSRLKPGTYTYFCRIHPFMRGSFRVQ
ncbi:cupredoxin domain-containing protein [Thermoleophilum album]|uniref:Blue (type 1) copper domain-containing protein n=1 Tax=Thermoleophilum album TaxID=29539 RepID=A0A1H6FW55_THEAL|nr:hypothetical protein [Thermoleophilum album]SEH14034.1 hypothetical protein SAMN02745716_1466 [Thermoleophilum album]